MKFYRKKSQKVGDIPNLKSPKQIQRATRVRKSQLANSSYDLWDYDLSHFFQKVRHFTTANVGKRKLAADDDKFKFHNEAKEFMLIANYAYKFTCAMRTNDS